MEIKTRPLDLTLVPDQTSGHQEEPVKTTTVEPHPQGIPAALGTETVSSLHSTYTLQEAYHELDEIPVRKVDPLEQLERNLEVLQDTQARLQFVMREVRYLMKA